MERTTLVRVAVAITVVVAQVAYWAAVADMVGQHAGGGCGYWSSGGPGRLLPWPSPPGLLAVITGMEPWDTAVCIAFRSGAFLPAIAGVGIVSDFVARRVLVRHQGLTESRPHP